MEERVDDTLLQSCRQLQDIFDEVANDAIVAEALASARGGLDEDDGMDGALTYGEVHTFSFASFLEHFAPMLADSGDEARTFVVRAPARCTTPRRPTRAMCPFILHMLFILAFPALSGPFESARARPRPRVVEGAG